MRRAPRAHLRGSPPATRRMQRLLDSPPCALELRVSGAGGDAGSEDGSGLSRWMAGRRGCVDGGCTPTSVLAECIYLPNLAHCSIASDKLGCHVPSRSTKSVGAHLTGSGAIPTDDACTQLGFSLYIAFTLRHISTGKGRITMKHLVQQHAEKCSIPSCVVAKLKFAHLSVIDCRCFKLS